MKILSNNNSILHIEFPTRKEITMTMGRPQEFYESGYTWLRNTVFSLEEFLDTFTDDDGDVSYYKSWSGFNIPSYKLNEFFNNFDLTLREEDLLEVINNNVSNSMYYVIATIAGDDRTIDHELVHANFYLNEDYQRAALKLVKALDRDIFNSMKATLLDMGYAKEVVNDEVNAYLSTSTRAYIKKRFDLDLGADVFKPFRTLAKTVL